MVHRRSNNYAGLHRNNSLLPRHMHTSRLAHSPRRLQSSYKCRFTSLKGQQIRPLISSNSSLNLPFDEKVQRRIVGHLEDFRCCTHHPLANRKVAPTCLYPAYFLAFQIVLRRDRFTLRPSRLQCECSPPHQSLAKPGDTDFSLAALPATTNYLRMQM